MHRGTFFSSAWVWWCASNIFNGNYFVQLLQTLSRSFPLTRTPTAAHFIVNNATCFLSQFKVMLRTSFHFVLRNYVIYKMQSIHSIITMRKKVGRKVQKTKREERKWKSLNVQNKWKCACFMWKHWCRKRSERRENVHIYGKCKGIKWVCNDVRGRRTFFRFE